MSDASFDGVLSFPVTPFADSGVDLAVFAEHLEHQLAATPGAAGPGAVFAACGTGEFPALDPAEHGRLARTAVEVVAGRVPVYVGVGGGPTVARLFAESAAAAGVDGVLLLPPYLVSSPARGLVRHVRAVAGTGGDLPVIVYQRGTARLSPEAAVELLDIPAVVGIKDGVGDVEAMLEIVTAVRRSGHPRAERFGFLNGLPTAELSALAYQAIGVPDYSSAAHCFVPELARAFHAALRRGDRAVVDRLLHAFYVPFARLRDEVPGYAVALVKAGVRLSGLDVGGVRPPLVDPGEAHLERLAEIVAAGRAALSRTGNAPDDEDDEDRDGEDRDGEVRER